MLNRSVSVSLKFHELPDDTCRLLATWTIPFLDKRGVFYASPSLVKSFVIPMREDIDTHAIDRYIRAMETVGLVRVFRSGGREWQYWPGFADNQIGLRDDRESTEYPPPPSNETPTGLQENAGSYPEGFRQVSGNMPAEVNRIEVEENGIEGKLCDAGAPPASPPAPAPKPRKPKPEPKQSENFRPIFGWLHELCQLNAPARIGKIAKRIDDTGATLEACEKFALWWQSCDWRGQKGQLPTPEQVWSEWPKSVAWDGMARPGTNGKSEPKGFAAIREAMQDPKWKEAEEKNNG